MFGAHCTLHTRYRMHRRHEWLRTHMAEMVVRWCCCCCCVQQLRATSNEQRAHGPHVKGTYNSGSAEFMAEAECTVACWLISRPFNKSTPQSGSWRMLPDTFHTNKGIYRVCAVVFRCFMSSQTNHRKQIGCYNLWVTQTATWTYIIQSN